MSQLSPDEDQTTNGLVGTKIANIFAKRNALKRLQSVKENLQSALRDVERIYEEVEQLEVPKRQKTYEDEKKVFETVEELEKLKLKKFDVFRFKYPEFTSKNDMQHFFENDPKYLEFIKEFHLENSNNLQTYERFKLYHSGSTGKNLVTIELNRISDDRFKKHRSENFQRKINIENIVYGLTNPEKYDTIEKLEKLMQENSVYNEIGCNANKIFTIYRAYAKNRSDLEWEKYFFEDEKENWKDNIQTKLQEQWTRLSMLDP